MWREQRGLMTLLGSDVPSPLRSVAAWYPAKTSERRPLIIESDVLPLGRCLGVLASFLARVLLPYRTS